jgi:putative endonuclease
MYYVYILKCVDGSLYTGVTNDVEKRMQVHRSGKGSKYVRSRMPFQLIHQEVHTDKSSALKREILIKSWPRARKIAELSLSQLIDL